MKNIKTFLFVFALSSTGFASTSYMSTAGGASQVALALQSAFSDSGAGVGAKEGSCLLCHGTSAGGPGNINAGFGADFQTAAAAVSQGTGGGSLSLSALASIFAEPNFAGKDSDADERTNQQEYLSNDDPASNITGATGGGGGCGTISSPHNKPPFTGLFLFLLPLAILMGLRQHLEASLK